MSVKYPPAKQDDLIEDYHGIPVADPYRWLENPDSPDTQAFTQAQNELFQSYIKDATNHAAIENRLKELWGFKQFGKATQKGDWIFYTLTDGSQDQPVLYKQKGLDGTPEILLDPNPLSEDNTIALMSQTYTKDGSLLCYSLSEHGSDWQKYYIKNTETGEDYPEVIQHTKFVGIAWKKDNSGFFYNRLPEVGSVPPEDQHNFIKVYYHQLGTDQSEDILIFEDPKNKERGFFPFFGDEGETLFLWIYIGTDRRNGLYTYKHPDDETFIPLFEPQEAKYDMIGNIGSSLFILTDLEAPNGRLIAVDLDNPDRHNWQVLIPEGEDAIDFVHFTNQQFIVATKKHASHRLHRYDTEGNLLGEITLPTLGSVDIETVTGGRDDKQLYFSYESFLFPATVLRYDFDTDTLSTFLDPGLNFDTDQYETSEAFYPSKDGTTIHMFLTHKKGLDLQNNNPTLLYGYGGFNISITPFFFLPRLTLLEQGWIYAVANIRGGDEYGEKWHQGGMLENKQNVFDDFIAAGEWLIENNYTSTPKLVIEGRSNGGLLTAACVTQRPDLYGAVLVVVPVIDMLRYHKFTVGRYWTPEYGNAEKDPDHFKFLYAYSPLHNVDPDADYPPILILTADTDDRVVPSHSKKFAATLQNTAPGENPILVRIETHAGHKLGKPVSKLVEENADIYTWLYKALGLEWR